MIENSDLVTLKVVRIWTNVWGAGKLWRGGWEKQSDGGERVLKNSGVAFSPDSDPKDGAKGYILVCHCWVYLCCPRKMRLRMVSSQILDLNFTSIFLLFSHKIYWNGSAWRKRRGWCLISRIQLILVIMSVRSPYTQLTKTQGWVPVRLRTYRFLSTDEYITLFYLCFCPKIHFNISFL